MSAVRKTGMGHNGGPSLDDKIIELAASSRFDPDRWAHLAWDWGVGPNWKASTGRASGRTISTGSSATT
jgi:hypothetical protein